MFRRQTSISREKILSRIRLLILIFGPLPIIAGSVALSRLVDAPLQPAVGNHLIRQDFPRWNSNSQSFKATSSAELDALRAHCHQTADELASRLTTDCEVVIHPPYVLAGNFDVAELERWYQQTVSPAAQIMANAFGLTPPTEPITLLLFRDQESYERHALRIYGDQNISIFGYYKPQSRVVVANLGSGAGTLLHELTHALFAFDFPRMPDWLNEGIASLHEQASLDIDHGEITGLVNWRLPVLRDAQRRGELDSLQELLIKRDFRGPNEGVHYAHARYFCMYLQQRGQLTEYYLLFRDQHANEPSGMAAIAALFPGQSWEQIDREFSTWLATLPE